MAVLELQKSLTLQIRAFVDYIACINLVPKAGTAKGMGELKQPVHPPRKSDCD